MIRALVLDFDGVILDTESAIILAAGELHREHGIAFDREQWLGAVGTTGIAADPWAAFDARHDRAELDRAHVRLYTEYFARLPVLPGVMSWLDSADKLRLPVGLASNSTRPYIAEHLDRLRLLERFSCVRCRDDVTAPKPAPELYLQVLQQLGVSGSEAIAVEDSQVGTLAARLAGLHVVAVPNHSTGGHDLSAAHLQLASLAEQSLPAVIAHFDTPPQA